MHLRIRIDFLSRLSGLKTVFPPEDRGNFDREIRNERSRCQQKGGSGMCGWFSFGIQFSSAKKTYPSATGVSFSHLFTILITNSLLVVYKVEKSRGRRVKRHDEVCSNLRKISKGGLAEV